jgi:hypothetical protein
MKKVFLALLALAAALAISPVAAAQSFNFTEGTDNFSGSLVTSGAPSNGGYDVTGGSFSIGSDSFTIVPNTNFPSSSLFLGNGIYDDILFPGGGPANLLNLNGLLFSDGKGEYVEIYQAGSNGDGTGTYTATTYGFWEGTSNNNVQINDRSGTFTVPEYGGLAMLILSALTLAGGFFLKGRQSGSLLAT